MDARILCLGLLARRDASGYEIKKAFEDGVIGHIQDASFGSIYPALSRLLVDGLVAVRTVSDAGRPARKIYTATPKGRMALVDALLERSEPDRLRSDFLFRLLFAELLPARQLEQALEARIADLERTIQAMQGPGCREHPTAGERFVHGYGLAVYQAARAYLQEHKHEVLRESLLAELAVAE